MLDYLYLGATLLHDSGSRSVVDATGLVGIPNIRGDVYPDADSDGAVEPSQQLLDSGLVTIIGEVWGATINAAWLEWDNVAAAFISAKDTPQLLRWQRAGGGLAFQRFVRLTGSVEPQISDGQAFLSYQVMLRSADPAAYSQTTKSAVFDPTGLPSQGRSYPRVWPIDYAGPGGAALTLVNDGNYKAKPVYTMIGPWTSSPWFRNATTGVSFYTTGLSLAAGEQLIVDTGARTVTYQGVDATSLVDWRNSDWPVLGPGGNVISLGGVPSAGSLFESSFNSAFIS